MVAKRSCIWIQGAGELASGVAFRLFRCGYRIVMAEVAKPKAVRRLVAFAEAVYASRTVVEGIPGRCFPAELVDFSADHVTICVDPAGRQIERLRPAAIVDGRMTKKEPDPLPAAGIPIVGLGPAIRCGRDAVYVVETHRQARLGTLLNAGEAAPNSGVPGLLGGETSRRLLRSPASGKLQPQSQIGELVREGETVATIAGRAVKSQIDGMLRGLIHPEAELSPGEKVGDVDPRGSDVDPGLVSDKSLAVAGGVLEGLLRLGVTPLDSGR